MINDTDLNDLKKAHKLLSSPSVAMKVANYIGKPLELGLESLPEGAAQKINEITQVSLNKALEAALYTMEDVEEEEASPWWHKAAAAVSGGVGGFFGLAALTVELPLSTVIMMRSIMDIARSEGMSISDQETKIECLLIFALGGESESDDAAESAYYAARIALGKAMGEAMEYIAQKTVIEKGAPVLVRLIATVAERFGIQVTEKVLAQGIPVAGALGGAGINLMFIDHFQDMARGHFVVKRLEKKYGKELVRKHFDQLSADSH